VSQATLTMLQLTRTVCGAQAEKLRAALARLLENPDEEAVHDVRVACRRLRVALRIARKLLGTRRVAPIRRQLKQLLTTLGEIRDAEVLAARARGVADAGGKDLASLLDSHTEMQRREAAANVARRSFPSLPERIEALLAEPATTDDARSRQEAGVWERAQRALEKHGDTLHTFARLHEESSARQLHVLRIAMKKVRYTAEFFAHAHGPARARRAGVRHDQRQTLRAIINAAQAYQELLGELHDAVVAQDVVEGWLRGAGRPSTLPAGAETDATLRRLLDAARADEKRLRAEFGRQWETEDFRY